MIFSLHNNNNNNNNKLALWEWINENDGKILASDLWAFVVFRWPHAEYPQPWRRPYVPCPVQHQHQLEAHRQSAVVDNLDPEGSSFQASVSLRRSVDSHVGWSVHPLPTLCLLPRLQSINKMPDNYHIISHHIVDLKWQNLKVGTVKPKLKVKMQIVSPDNVRKRFLDKPGRRQRKVYSDWENVTSPGRAFQVFGQWGLSMNEWMICRYSANQTESSEALAAEERTFFEKFYECLGRVVQWGGCSMSLGPT